MEKSVGRGVGDYAPSLPTIAPLSFRVCPFRESEILSAERCPVDYRTLKTPRSRRVVVAATALIALFAVGAGRAAETTGLENINPIDWAADFSPVWKSEDLNNPATQVRLRDLVYKRYIGSLPADHPLRLLAEGVASGGPGLETTRQVGEKVAQSGMAASAAAHGAFALGLGETAVGKSLDSINNALTDLGFLLTTYQMMKEVSEGEVENIDQRMLVYAKDVALAYLNRFPEDKIVTFTALGLAFIDYSLTKFMTEMLTDYEQAYYEVYAWLFLDGPGKQTWDQWADRFVPPDPRIGLENVDVYLDSFFDQPSRFLQPGYGNFEETQEIFEVYYQEKGKATRLTFRSALVNAKLKEKIREQFIKEHLIDRVRPILQRRRERMEANLELQVRRAHKAILYHLDRLNNRREYTVEVRNKLNGAAVEGAAVECRTMYERADLKTDAQGRCVVNVPALTPKVHLRVWSPRFKEAEISFAPEEQKESNVAVHLEGILPAGLTVKVEDEKDHSPIAGAKITYEFEEKKSTGETDSTGYAYQKFPDGMFVQVSVTAPSYMDWGPSGFQIHEEGLEAQIEMRRNEKIFAVGLTIEARDAISDKPIAGATVTAKYGGRSETATAGGDGVAVVKLLPDTPVEVVVSAPEHKNYSDTFRIPDTGWSTSVWLESSSKGQEPSNLQIALEGVQRGDKAPVGQRVSFKYQYNVAAGSKHDLQVAIYDEKNQEVAQEYRAGMSSAGGAESGVLNLDGVPKAGTYRAALTVRYDGKDYKSAPLEFSAGSSYSFEVAMLNEDGQKTGKIERHETGTGSVAPDFPEDAGLEKVEWTLVTPTGRRVASDKNNTPNTKGRRGLTIDLNLGEKAPLGKYRLEATVFSRVETFNATGEFSLVESEAVPPDSEFAKVGVAPAGKLQTGQWTELNLSGLPFKVEDAEKLQVNGIAYWGRGYFDTKNGRVRFRPKKDGSQTPMFSLTYGDQKINCKFDCNVEMTKLETTMRWSEASTQMRYVPYTISIPAGFEPPFRIARAVPREIGSLGEAEAAGQGFQVPGNLGYIYLKELHPEILIRDKTGASGLAKLEGIQELRLDLGSGGVGDKVPIKLLSPPNVGAVLKNGVESSSNVEWTQNGMRHDFFLKTDSGDRRQQEVWIGMAGDRGLAIGTRTFNLGASTAKSGGDCVCDSPPPKVARLLKKYRDYGSVMASAMNAANPVSVRNRPQQAQETTNDMVEILGWLGGLKDCRHLTDAHRSYYGDMAKALGKMNRLFNGTGQTSESEMRSIMSEMERLSNKSKSLPPIKDGFMEGSF